MIYPVTVIIKHCVEFAIRFSVALFFCNMPVWSSVSGGKGPIIWEIVQIYSCFMRNKGYWCCEKTTRGLLANGNTTDIRIRGNYNSILLKSLEILF